MFCTNCGGEVRDGAQFCTYCGARMQAGPEADGPVAAASVRTGGSPGLAALCSVIIPGSYHLYRGDTVNGAGLLFSFLAVILALVWAGNSSVAGVESLYAAVMIVCVIGWIFILVLAAVTAVDMIRGTPDGSDQ